MPLAWSEIPYAKVPAVLRSDTVYLRLVGDRSIPEEEFGKVIGDRSVVIGYSAGKLKEKQEIIKPHMFLATIISRGFGPATVNLFRRSAGLEPVDWTARTGQKTLF